MVLVRPQQCRRSSWARSIHRQVKGDSSKRGLRRQRSGYAFTRGYPRKQCTDDICRVVRLRTCAKIINDLEDFSLVYDALIERVRFGCEEGEGELTCATISGVIF